MKKILCLTLILTVSTTEFAGGNQPAFHKHIPSLKTFATMAVSIYRLTDKTSDPALFPEPAQRLVNAAVGTIRNLTGSQHNDQLADVDCPDIALCAIAKGWLNPNKAFLSAVKKGQYYTAKELIARGADVHTEADKAIIKATEVNSPKIVNLLLDHGVDPNVHDGGPLRTAVNYKRTEIVAIFLAHGADVHTANDYPLKYAEESGDQATQTVIRAHLDRLKALRTNPY